MNSSTKEQQPGKATQAVAVIWVFAISVICVIVGLRSVYDPDVGWDTLLFFVAGGLLPVMLFASEIVISKDGINLKGISFLANKAIREGNVGGKHKSSQSGEGSDDPQKGQWGGVDFRDGFRIAAAVTPVPDAPELFLVRLVTGGPAARSGGAAKVHYHLHPTFKNPSPEVQMCSGKAVLELVAWGAFTVGVSILDKNGTELTRLELDLATLPDAPDVFVSR